MKKAARRLMSLALVLAMMLGLGVTVSAKGGETVGEGDTIIVNAPFGGSACDIQWAGYDESIISVYPSYDGYQAYVTGLRAGSTTITVYATATDDDGNYSFLTQYIKVTVTASKSYEDPLYIYMDSAARLDVGDSYYLTVYATGGDGRYSYSWSSSDKSVARVSGRGETVTVSALRSGNAAISVTVTSGTQTEYATCAFYIEGRKTATTYDTSASANVGSYLNMSSIASSIGNAFSRDLGVYLDYTSTVRSASATAAR